MKATPMCDKRRTRADTYVQRMYDRIGYDPMDSEIPSAPDLPDGAELYLLECNPRLQELRKSYALLEHPATRHSRWSQAFVDSEVPLTCFRADCAYLYQIRDLNAQVHYLVTAEYIAGNDRLNLLRRLSEDTLFGVYAVRRNDSLLLTRDLLDSISEFYFLEPIFSNIRGALNVLDIGAGYGRFAHRICCASEKIGKVFCVDAVAESTFICEYYLSIRGVEHRAVAVPLPMLEDTLMSEQIDMAVSIHSLSECRLEVIAWWLHIIRKYRVRYLFIVPNARTSRGLSLTSFENDGTHADFRDLILQYGYRLVERRPKYQDPLVQRFGVSPTHYFLFELE